MPPQTLLDDCPPIFYKVSATDAKFNEIGILCVFVDELGNVKQRPAAVDYFII